MKSKFWINRKSWPFAMPGYAFLPAAFDAIGKAMFRDSWTGDEGSYSDHGSRPPSPHNVFQDDTDWPADENLFDLHCGQVLMLLGLEEDGRAPTWQQWCDACDRWQYFETYGRRIAERREKTIDFMHQAAALGALIFTTRTSAGHMEDLRPELWNCDRPIINMRLEACAIHETDPLAGPAALFRKYGSRGLAGFTRPLFVRLDHLEVEAAAIGRWYRGEVDTPTLDIAPASPGGSGGCPTDQPENVAETKADGWSEAQSAAMAIYRDRLLRGATVRVQKSEAGEIAKAWRGPARQPADRRITEFLTGMHSQLRFRGDRVDQTSAEQVIALIDAKLARDRS